MSFLEMNKIIIICISLLISAITTINAQLDTRHYIPPVYVTSAQSTNSGFVNQHFIVLNTPESTPFEVTVTDGAGNPIPNSPFTISESSPLSIQLPGVQHNAQGVIRDDELNQINTADALILTADRPFYVNLRHFANSQGASLSSKGSVALGTEFRSGHMYFHQNPGSSHDQFIAVMATEDNTMITFDDFNEGITWLGQTSSGSPLTADPISITLNAGESFVLGQPGQNINATYRNNYNGTRITSTKSIAVNSGSFLGPGGTSGQDIGFDQLVPIERAGDNFVLIKGPQTNEVERGIVVATTDNTEVFLNGNSTAVATLNAGDYYVANGSNWTVNNNMLIKTSQPTMVYQTTFGVGSSMATPSMNLIPANNPCAGTDAVAISNVRQWGSATINVLVRTGSTTTIKENGAVVLTLNAATTNNSNVHPTDADGSVWYSYQHNVAASGTVDVLVESDNVINVGFTGGSGVVGAAGYFSGFAPAPIIIGNATDLCGEVTIEMELLNIFGYASFEWYRNGALIPGVTSASYMPTESGVYSARGVFQNCTGFSDMSGTFPVNTSSCEGPANVGEDLRLWLKADAGITENGTVSQWEDQSFLDFITTAPAGEEPDFVTEGINYNPTVRFTDDRLIIPADGFFNDGELYEGINVYAVFKDNDQTNADWFLYEGTQLSDRFSLGWNFAGSDDANMDVTTTGIAGNIVTNAPAPQVTLLTALSNKNAINGDAGNLNQVLFFNGQEIVGNTNSVTYMGTNTVFEIGDHEENVGGTSPDEQNNPFGGDLSELIILTGDQTNEERFRLETYLALKYGITLTHDYLSSNGNLLWDTDGTDATYSNDIAGIGRDDAGTLYQKQSRNSDGQLLVIALDTDGNGITTTNQNNLNTFATDQQFLVWGHNGGTTDFSASGGIGTHPQLYNRVWKAAEWEGNNNTDGLTNLAIGFHKNTANLTLADNNYVLLIDDEGDGFSDETGITGTTVGDNLVFSGVNLNHNDLFTIAANTPPSFTSSNTTDFLENSTTVVLNIEAIDDASSEGNGLTYSFTSNPTNSPDEGFFDIDMTTGELTFINPPDFESPLDDGEDNGYQIEVEACDGQGLCSTQVISVNVTNEPENPLITSNNGDANVNIAIIENQSFVQDINATDPEGELENTGEGDQLDYSLSGADANIFEINDRGELVFSNPPNFENPQDGGNDNVYEVTVIVTDSGGLTASQNWMITIQDEDEDGDGYINAADPDDADPCNPDPTEAACQNNCNTTSPVITKNE